MAFTDDDIQRLSDALAHGEQSTQHGDQSTTYRSVDDILKALDRAQAVRSREAGKSQIVYGRLTGGFER